MGGWEAGGAEADRIVYGSIKRLPLQVIWTGLRNGVVQLTLVRSVEGFGQRYKFLAEAIDLVLPADYEQFNRSRQQNGGLYARGLSNFIYMPVQLGALLALALWTALRWRAMSPPLRVFCLMILGGLVANAFICGGLSNPLNRYQGRVAWLAVLAVGIVLSARRHVPASQS
jgi:hypothetical protein